LKQQLGKQGAIIEYQDENLKEIEQQCVLEKSFMEKIEKFLQNAVFSATMLGNLINDMLDLAKFESGTFKFHNDFFDLIEVIEQAFETIRYQAERKEITVSY
jgi:signal transduction histidine kinase